MTTIYQKRNLKEILDNLKKEKEDGLIWLNIRDASKIIEMSHTWVYNAFLSGEIDSIVRQKKGTNRKHRLVHIDELIAYVKKIYFEKDLN
jgi:hypothetical protein